MKAIPESTFPASKSNLCDPQLRKEAPTFQKRVNTPLHHEPIHHQGHHPTVASVELIDLDDHQEHRPNELTMKPRKMIVQDAFRTSKSRLSGLSVHPLWRNHPRVAVTRIVQAVFPTSESKEYAPLVHPLWRNHRKVAATRIVQGVLQVSR